MVWVCVASVHHVAAMERGFSTSLCLFDVLRMNAQSAISETEPLLVHERLAGLKVFFVAHPGTCLNIKPEVQPGFLQFAAQHNLVQD